MDRAARRCGSPWRRLSGSEAARSATGRARRREEDEERGDRGQMRRGEEYAGDEGYLYRQTRCNRRSDLTAPSACPFAFNGGDVAVRGRSSTSETDRCSTASDSLLSQE